LWCQRQAATGDVKPNPRPASQPDRKINDLEKDLEKFRAFVKTHGDKTQREMAQLWDTEVSQPTISRALKQIKYTRKKTYSYVQRDEAKRAAFLAQRPDPQAPHLVYVDEAGRDEHDN